MLCYLICFYIALCIYVFYMDSIFLLCMSIVSYLYGFYISIVLNIFPVPRNHPLLVKYCFFIRRQYTLTGTGFPMVYIHFNILYYILRPFWGPSAGPSGDRSLRAIPSATLPPAGVGTFEPTSFWIGSTAILTAGLA
jgi:hypothetical protein